jgi:ethanolamine transporter
VSLNQIILWIMAIGILVGALDRVIGNKFSLGAKFEEGFNAMGPLALGMVGIITLAPLISKILGPVIFPIFNLIHCDPAMFATMLANDMGGYPLAMRLAQKQQAGLFAGLIVSSMLGCTLVFSIPVGLGLIEYKDRPFFVRGLLIGLITIPFGGMVGGIAARFDLTMLLVNSIPTIFLALCLILGLIYIPDKMIRGALIFGKFIVIVITVGLAAAAFQEVTKKVLMPGMAPIMDGIIITGQIAVVLLGTFPALALFTRVLNKPLTRVGRMLGMDATGAAGIVITLANSIPVYKMMKDMNPKSKVINVAWLVPATAALGDHLGFTAGVKAEMIAAVVIGKLSAGVLAIVLCIWMSKDLSQEIAQSEATSFVAAEAKAS